ncbi:MAG: hypothetical protein AAGG01_21205 [Planctomycetota bacterium]
MERNGARSGAQTAILSGVAIVCVTGLVLVSGAHERFLGALGDLLGSGGGAANEEAGARLGEAPETAFEPSLAAETPADGTAVAASATRAETAVADQAYDWNEAAVEALGRGEKDEAIQLLEKATDAAPGNAVYIANLAEAYVRRARAFPPEEFEEAETDFDRALELLVDERRRAQVEALLDRARTIHREEASFSVEETLHFTFKFDASRDEIRAGVDELQRLLEDTYQEYGDLFGRRPVEAGEPKIAVVLYRSEGFNSVTGLGDWAGGAFDGKIRVPADDLRDVRRLARLRDVMRHEVAHAFTQSVGGTRVPSWLNEGIAQWLEDPAKLQDSVKIARTRLANARSQGGKALFRLSEIQGSLASWTDKSEITRAYDEALAFTDYLVGQYGARLLFDLVDGCKEGGVGGAAAAFERQLLVDIEVVLSDFEAGL